MPAFRTVVCCLIWSMAASCSAFASRSETRAAPDAADHHAGKDDAPGDAHGPLVAGESLPGPGTILPPDRATTWRPGLNAVGGIPHRSKICTTIQPTGADDTAVIQRALDTCPEGTVIQLGDGTFHVTGQGLAIIRSGLTLRGNGPERTRLVKPRGTGHHVIIVGHRWVKYTQPTSLASNALKGKRSLTLLENPGLVAGEIVLLDQMGDPRWTRWNPTNQPPGHPSRGWTARFDRPLAQVMEIESVKGDVVSFTTPFHIDFLVANEAQLTRYAGGQPGGPMVPATKWSGVEDLYLAHGDGGQGNLHFFDAAYSWARNIESALSDGTSVAFAGSFRCEVRDSYIHTTLTPNPGGGGYGIGWSHGAADNLAENNVVWNFNKVMVMQASGGGNVVGYNYMDDGWGAGYPTIPEVGLNASHMTTPHYELFEGNQSWNFGGDSYWGNSIYITVFRNHLTGRRRSAAPLRLTDAVQRRFIDVPEWHWWYSFIGNVLGTPEMNSAPQARFRVDAAPPWAFDPVPLWVIGPQRDSKLGGQDREVRATIIRHGNFDYFQKKVTWDPAIAPREMPPSLYLHSKPEFFGSRPWPWVRPEHPDQPLARLPARERFDTMIR